MDIVGGLNEIINNTKNLNLNLNYDSRIENLKEDLTKVTENAIGKAAKYVIKAMPVPDAVKDILTDVSEALKTRDFNKIISTVVKSTIREGLESIGLSSSSIKSLMELKDVASKGGFVMAVKNGIEIFANNYLKNNIVGNYVYKFFNNLEVFVQSKDFMKKINIMIKKLDEKKDEFIKKCEEWFKAYNNMNKEEMNKIAEKLNNNTYVLNRYSECVKENNIIKNMTEMINNNKALLSENQQRLIQVVS